MCQVPERKVIIDDSAMIFDTEEERKIAGLAEDLSVKHDINVVVLTTNGIDFERYEGDDEHRMDNKDDIENVYMNFSYNYYLNSVVKFLKDNSGILILLDFTKEAEGGRFFYLYTYGTTYYSIPDFEAVRILNKYKSSLNDGYYYDSVIGIMNQVKKHNFIIADYVVPVVQFTLPIPLTIIVMYKIVHRKRYKSSCPVWWYTGDYPYFDDVFIESKKSLRRDLLWSIKDEFSDD